MKKIKLLVLSFTIIGGVSAAVTSHLSAPCTTEAQWYADGDWYTPVFMEGVDYNCIYDLNSTCTYVYDPTIANFVPCKTGRYEPIRTK
ncbi:hypothetical protein LX64_00417 [Chitinophaga skermanii]|uniref:Uncharacterized protein n=1 Tax=Chitinophaga skermanii TaxID=331697 RepID=A0A327R2C3_9BACT|nr:hypothetical protein [Chitinophaga skermanii]RAJ10810.1 hypothetical protein LX64_00417 [Chitinophaga skermanii]